KDNLEGWSPSFRACLSQTESETTRPSLPEAKNPRSGATRNLFSSSIAGEERFDPAPGMTEGEAPESICHPERSEGSRSISTLKTCWVRNRKQQSLNFPLTNS